MTMAVYILMQIITQMLMYVQCEVLAVLLMDPDLKTSIPCSRETLETLKARKRGGETWDSLLRKLGANYDPDQ